jgi:Protein of unknown function (DUF3143)
MPSMTLIPTDTPLYNHPLPEIEQWLISMGCEQDELELHCWHINRPDWQAELSLDIEELTVRYQSTTVPSSSNDVQNIYRTFKYSLSRQDIENAVFAGP